MKNVVNCVVIFMTLMLLLCCRVLASDTNIVAESGCDSSIEISQTGDNLEISIFFRNGASGILKITDEQNRLVYIDALFFEEAKSSKNISFLYNEFDDGVYTIEFACMDAVYKKQFTIEKFITRGHFAKLVADMFYTKNEIPESVFPDVAREYASEIGTLKKHGVLTGYPDGNFRPEQMITRTEMLAALTRVFWDKTGFEYGYNEKFEEVSICDAMPRWALNYIGCALTHGYARIETLCVEQVMIGITKQDFEIVLDNFSKLLK